MPIIQKLWQPKLEWDEQVSDDLVKRYGMSTGIRLDIWKFRIYA